MNAPETNFLSVKTHRPGATLNFFDECLLQETLALLYIGHRQRPSDQRQFMEEHIQASGLGQSACAWSNLPGDAGRVGRLISASLFLIKTARYLDRNRVDASPVYETGRKVQNVLAETGNLRKAESVLCEGLTYTEQGLHVILDRGEPHIVPLTQPFITLCKQYLTGLQPASAGDAP